MTRTETKAALFTLALSLISAGCSSPGTEGPSIEVAKAYVKAAPVTVGPLERSLELTGTVEAGKSADLVPEMAGKVVELNVMIGDKVAKGQVLARLDTRLVDLQVRQANAAVSLASLQLKTAEREFARAKGLHEKGSMPQQQYEQAMTALDMARLQLEQAKAALALARRRQSGGVVVAPFDGVVTWIACEVNDTFNPMTPAMGKPSSLVSVADMSTIKIDLQVSDNDIGHVAPGMTARIFVDALADRLPPDGLIGTVAYVGKAADPVAHTFPVRVLADNPDETVLIGTHARVRLVLERRDKTVWVPTKAVFEGDAPYVLVAESDRAKKVAVRTGLRGDNGIEILSGLSGNEMVIVEGGFGLIDGARIEVAK